MLNIFKLKSLLKFHLKQLFLAWGVDIKVATTRRFVATYIYRVYPGRDSPPVYRELCTKYRLYHKSRAQLLCLFRSSSFKRTISSRMSIDGYMTLNMATINSIWNAPFPPIGLCITVRRLHSQDWIMPWFENSRCIYCRIGFNKHPLNESSMRLHNCHAAQIHTAQCPELLIFMRVSAEATMSLGFQDRLLCNSFLCKLRASSAKLNTTWSKRVRRNIF